MVNVPRGRVPLEEIPERWGGEKMILADTQWDRVVGMVAEHLPEILIDLEDSHGELMNGAVEYGTRLSPGDEPLLGELTDEEYVARTGAPAWRKRWLVEP